MPCGVAVMHEARARFSDRLHVVVIDGSRVQASLANGALARSLLAIPARLAAAERHDANPARAMFAG